jgi:hypothetical protein
MPAASRTAFQRANSRIIPSTPAGEMLLAKVDREN